MENVLYTYNANHTLIAQKEKPALITFVVFQVAMMTPTAQRKNHTVSMVFASHKNYK